jgi:hypothetical protein
MTTDGPLKRVLAKRPLQFSFAPTPTLRTGRTIVSVFRYLVLSLALGRVAGAGFRAPNLHRVGLPISPLLIGHSARTIGEKLFVL